LKTTFKHKRDGNFFCVDGSSHNFDAVLAHSLLYFKGYFYEVSIFLIFEDI